ncbi:MAG: DNA repair protein RecN [Gammaproteobacteria bacterium]|nr:DNA repair protein RecN [Gammaproteobacteria bacterium]
MLTHLGIRDFAIIENLELDLGAGMTVLTGETGAGKSIIVDALLLALGGRAENGMIRHGATRAEISASFDLGKIARAREWLNGHDLDDAPDCVLRRIITLEGRSKAYINGSTVPLQLLQELGDLLVDIHGQHEHQSLLQRNAQREHLDDYAGHAPMLADLASLHKRWISSTRELDTLLRAQSERETRLTLLRYQVQELDALKLEPDEWPALNAEHARLANVNRLLEATQGALSALYENEQGSALGLLTHSANELQKLHEYDTGLIKLSELLDGAAIQLQEAVNELRHYLDHLEGDPERLHKVEQRLATIHDLARKHRITPDELPDLHRRLAEELANIEGADARLDQLQKEAAAARQAYLMLAEKLSAARAKQAKELQKQVTARMQQLGMPGGRFEIQLERVAEDQYSAHGLERVEFLVSANPGQPLKPLNKVASGGELSRISLAIQVISAQSGRIPTLIFDEVDVGVGGGVAEIVGQQLCALSEQRQVLCVTHLPQVAAQGRHHIQVSKETKKDATRITLRPLGAEERRDEIARMLGGVKITEQTLAHAGEMLDNAQLGESKVKRARS